MFNSCEASFFVYAREKAPMNRNCTLILGHLITLCVAARDFLSNGRKQHRTSFTLALYTHPFKKDFRPLTFSS
jgi:hypothetical protein